MDFVPSIVQTSYQSSDRLPETLGNFGMSVCRTLLSQLADKQPPQLTDKQKNLVRSKGLCVLLLSATNRCPTSSPLSSHFLCLSTRYIQPWRCSSSLLLSEPDSTHDCRHSAFTAASSLRCQSYCSKQTVMA